MLFTPHYISQQSIKALSHCLRAGVRRGNMGNRRNWEGTVKKMKLTRKESKRESVKQMNSIKEIQKKKEKDILDVTDCI